MTARRGVVLRVGHTFLTRIVRSATGEVATSYSRSPVSRNIDIAIMLITLVTIT